jgi:O-phospho-L-seryl-tRNASec:L-selenocysteinyl-tRNA synthase
MDSNNFPSHSGVGEREGRIFSPLLSKQHYYLAHGIGRSGDLFSLQPKAAGSSLVLKLTCALAKHALSLAGLGKVDCLVVPLATGMSLSLCLLALRPLRPVPST